MSDSAPYKTASRRASDAGEKLPFDKGRQSLGIKPVQTKKDDILLCEHQCRGAIDMNKAQLIDSIADKSDLSKADAGKALEAFTASVEAALRSGDRVSLVGFGSFSVDRRDARTGRNPRTGESIEIAAKNVVKFKPGANLTNSVN